ncbi:MAG TPA: antitoxin [Oribacterium sp.]|nr:antitoxin [Oribacterium sp.]
MDAKFYKRFESFKKSLAALEEVRSRDLGDSFVLSGTSAKFSITFDLAWKVMKDIIIQDYAVVDFPKGSPKEVLRKAFEFQLISDDLWMEMLRNRNELTHDYDGEIIRVVCHEIIDKYLGLFDDFQELVERRYGGIDTKEDEHAGR